MGPYLGAEVLKLCIPALKFLFIDLDFPLGDLGKQVFQRRVHLPELRPAVHMIQRIGRQAAVLQPFHGGSQTGHRAVKAIPEIDDPQHKDQQDGHRQGNQ